MGTRNYHIKVLGDYLHTRYNTPTESYCSGTDTEYESRAGGDCASVACNNLPLVAIGKSGWLSEVDENGSGYSATIGYISLEWLCSTGLKPYRRVPNPCPQCGVGYRSVHRLQETPLIQISPAASLSMFTKSAWLRSRMQAANWHLINWITMQGLVAAIERLARSARKRLVLCGGVSPDGSSCSSSFTRV